MICFRPRRVIFAKPSRVTAAAAATTRGSSPSASTMCCGFVRARAFNCSIRVVTTPKLSQVHAAVAHGPLPVIFQQQFFYAIRLEHVVQRKMSKHVENRVMGI